MKTEELRHKVRRFLIDLDPEILKQLDEEEINTLVYLISEYESQKPDITGKTVYVKAEGLEGAFCLCEALPNGLGIKAGETVACVKPITINLPTEEEIEKVILEHTTFGQNKYVDKGPDSLEIFEITEPNLKDAAKAILQLIKERSE